MKKQEPIRVIVAEDDFLVSQDIARAVAGIGYKNVGIAANGQKAVELTLSLRPDVVLMDVKMPKLDGIEATRQIQQNLPTPVVMVTAYESRGLLEKAAKAGAAAYLTKPSKAPEIERAITMAIARHKDLMELRRLTAELENALAEINALQGLLHICAGCKKICNDKGEWQLIETYISEHSEAQFSHSICPDCSNALYPDFVVAMDAEDDPR